MNILQRVCLGVSLLLVTSQTYAAGIKLPVFGMWNGKPVVSELDAFELKIQKPVRQVDFVVMEQPMGGCTMTFISETSALTAAHCVDQVLQKRKLAEARIYESVKKQVEESFAEKNKKANKELTEEEKAAQQKEIDLILEGTQEKLESYVAERTQFRVRDTKNGTYIKSVNAFWYDFRKSNLQLFDLAVIVFPEKTASQLGIKEFPEISIDQPVKEAEQIWLVGYGVGTNSIEHYFKPYFEYLKSKLDEVTDEEGEKSILEAKTVAYKMILLSVVQSEAMSGRVGSPTFYRMINRYKAIAEKETGVTVSLSSGAEVSAELEKLKRQFELSPYFWDFKKVGTNQASYTYKAEGDLLDLDFDHEERFIRLDALGENQEGFFHGASMTRNRTNNGVDATVVQGDSGGPVYNKEGLIVGVSTILYQDDLHIQGRGFSVALQSDQAKFLFDQVQNCQKVTSGQCGALGLDLKGASEVAEADQWREMIKTLHAPQVQEPMLDLSELVLIKKLTEKKLLEFSVR